MSPGPSSVNEAMSAWSRLRCGDAVGPDDQLGPQRQMRTPGDVSSSGVAPYDPGALLREQVIDLPPYSRATFHHAATGTGNALRR